MLKHKIIKKSKKPEEPLKIHGTLDDILEISIPRDEKEKTKVDKTD